MIANKIFKDSKKGFKKTYSIQFRFLATVIAAMLVIAVFIGGISIYEVDNYIQEQSENFVKVTCENEGAQINDTFGDMEKSVKIMESYIKGFFTADTDVTDRDFQDRIINSSDIMFADVAQNTNGVIAYYFRFDPAISDGKSGLFYCKLEGSDQYTKFEPTDITIYKKNDVEHVGWFWQPYEAGKPVWMKPYHNQNNNILMISYVIPIYFEKKFVGVVGMDFDYKVFSDQVSKIKVFDEGFAHLEIDGVAITTFDQKENTKYKDTNKYLQVSKNLVNGMTLVLSASYDDIRQIRYEIAFKILFTVLILLVLFTFFVILIVKKIIGPLKKLTDASVKLAEGDYNVEIVDSNTYEIKLLNTAFENMTTRLREREKNLKLSANRDSLTGLRNTTSYNSWVKNFNSDIKEENTNFGLVVLDINCLKQTNDKYGHDVGNELIVTAAKIISSTFKNSPVFRLGGDEFLVILQDSDLEQYESLFEIFDSKCKESFVEIDDEKISICIAKGFSSFDYENDQSFADVLHRADEAMYENKREMKALFALN